MQTTARICCRGFVTALTILLFVVSALAQDKAIVWRDADLLTKEYPKWLQKHGG